MIERGDGWFLQTREAVKGEVLTRSVAFFVFVPAEQQGSMVIQVVPLVLVDGELRPGHGRLVREEKPNPGI